MARKPLSLISGVTVVSQDGVVTVNGPKGTLVVSVPTGVVIEVVDTGVKIISDDSSFQGTAAANILNAMKGVSTGWTRVLELNGTGYRAAVAGKVLNLSLGFSHPVAITATDGISFDVKENKITVLGADKVMVGQTAAKIRALRPADPYKAKGFKYDNEVIIRKAGKAAKAGGAGAK